MTKTTKTQTTAQKVKAAIKAAGIPTKHISVTTSYPGYEEVITVTIKDTNINIDDVEKIARRFREVAIDERCQEILQGGNTFVNVRYDYNALDAAVKALEPLAADVLKRINTTPTESRFKVVAPNGSIIELLTFTNSDHWAIYDTCYSVNDIDHRASVRPSDYYPEHLPHALARIFFNLGARWVDQIPDPSNDFYVIEKMGKGYSVAASCPGAQSAENCAKDCIMYDRRLDPEFNPVYFVCTASEVLAMADKTGIHYPKNRPQPTPESVKALIKEFNALNKAS